MCFCLYVIPHYKYWEYVLFMHWHVISQSKYIWHQKDKGVRLEIAGFILNIATSFNVCRKYCMFGSAEKYYIAHWLTLIRKRKGEFKVTYSVYNFWHLLFQNSKGSQNVCVTHQFSPPTVFFCINIYNRNRLDLCNANWMRNQTIDT